jgi:hypothetical protein
MKYKVDKLIISDRNLIIDTKNIFFDIDKSPLLRKRMEDIRNILKKKYNIKAIQICGVNKEETHMISSLENQLWHDFLWTSTLMGSKVSNFVERLTKFFKLKPGEASVDYAGVTDTSGVRISSYLLGINLEGYHFSFNNSETHNKIYFVVAFQNININDVQYATYANLIKDLEKLEAMLDTFLEYFKLYGTIDDSIILQNMLNKNEDFTSLIF